MPPVLLMSSVLGCGVSQADVLERWEFDRVEVEVGHQTAAVAPVDVDGDGRVELLVAAGDHAIVVANAGEGRFNVSQRVEAGPHAVDLAVADLDDDGTPDIAVANHETTHLTTLFGSPDGFQARGDPRLQVDVDPHPHAVGLADVDGDGFVDLLVDDRGRESLRVLPGRGDGTFGESSLVYVGGDPYRGFLLSDLDEDGQVDIVTPNPGRVAVTLGQGSGEFEPPSSFDPGFAPFSVSIGDFDGDGRTDLAAGSGEGAGRIAVMTGRGDGTFEAAVRHDIAAGPTRTTAADLDGDGRDELIVSSYLGGEVAVLSGDGLQRISLDGSPYGLAAGDFDGDGRIDFAVANDATTHVTIFLTRSNGAPEP